ncbi:hypothetical protein OGAPHI_003841 [Ogataea philodendri]|uniref:Major facilitator superfamily (MFS) profile domain-containing protein n=1 Tax=Ogataea philodendri TaxID=1378263 RepID=A0A9P8P536_9ASCO|nr:uncharacterized protein OGAPHI_003841 [Ogataea philodendri]KAH3665653.1 hypothetical protein OGAPHI_003841 [Ogataea philodendri]
MSRPITVDDIPKAVLVGKPLLYFTTGFVSLCVFLFGYDQGYFSSILTNTYFKDYFDNPTALEIGTVVAILEIGALISSLSLGPISDKLGRRKTTRLGAFIFCIGGSIQSGSSSIAHLAIGRFVSGIGVGFLSGTAPSFQAEISAPENRGLLGSAQFTGNIMGYASSIWIDFGCSFIESNWSFRIPLMLQVVFGSILFLGTFALVESPRWLLEHDHDAEGLVVIADLFSDGHVHSDKAREEYKAIKESVLIGRLEGDLNYLDVFRRYPRRIFVAMTSQMFAQFNGINVISYYAPLVFEQAGWVGRNAILLTGINALLYVLSSIPPWFLTESWGRKPVLIMGGLVMGLALCAVSTFSKIETSNSATMVVIFVMIYNSFFGCSWGPIGWLNVEVLPTKARASGAAMATATNWLCNFVVGELAPLLLEKIQWRLYLIHATSCFISVVTVWKMYPETKGLSLEEMDSVFDDRSSVYSTHSGNLSGFGSTSDLEAWGNRSGLITGNTPQAARNPAAAAGENNPLIPGSKPFILPQDIEPPDLATIYKFKTDDSHSIRGSLRKGSEAVSSIFRLHRSNHEDASVASDSVSERFINTSH